MSEPTQHSPLSTRHSLPRYLTADLPPLPGARIKDRPEDFFVDEQPLYQPSGHGEHIYLFVEKRNLSTLAALRILARHFGVHESAVGYAGLKDKHAVTRQVFSVHAPGKRLEDFTSLQHDRLSILWADYHTNKLRRGHLLGNRFSIRIRGIPPTAVLTANKALQQLEKLGIPNRIGEQRFGYRGNNHLVGRAIVLGDFPAALDALLAPDESIQDRQIEARRLYAAGNLTAALHAFPHESRTERAVLGALIRGSNPAKAIAAMSRSELDFFLTAFQSAIFNTVLDARLAENALGTLAPGDLAIKHDNRAVFEVLEHDLGPELTARLDRFEISPSGPMWGPEMKRAKGLTDQREVAALAAAGVSLDALSEFAHRRPGRTPALPGERRALRVPLTDPDVEGGVDEHGSFVRIAFDLPRGAFATTVLRELIKPEQWGNSLAAEE
jgi:tRNA pseudouridine13 synthase